MLPISDYDHLKALSKEDNDRILEAILEIWPPRAHDMEITGVTYRLDPESLDHTAENSEDLQGQLNRLRDIMISVSTGGPRINEINAEYKRHYWLNRGSRNPTIWTPQNRSGCGLP